ncbi:MAG: hypothetical protein V3S64_07250 [bacterium]
MTTFTIAHAPESKIVTLAKAVLDTLSSLREITGTVPKPVIMIPNALSVTREEVERKLSQPAWRSIGRYL